MRAFVAAKRGRKKLVCAVTVHVPDAQCRSRAQRSAVEDGRAIAAAGFLLDLGQGVGAKRAARDARRW